MSSEHPRSPRDLERSVGRLKKPRSVAEEVLFQPWFLPLRVAYSIHGLVPPAFWKKMRYFFDDYGCMICGAESGYHSNGMCVRCHALIRKKIKLSAMRRASSEKVPRLDLALFRQEKLARKLLVRFATVRQSSKRVRRTELPRCNPVYEALSGRYQP